MSRFSATTIDLSQLPAPDVTPPATGTATTGTAFPYKTDAWARYGRRAFLWDRGPHHLATGEETPLKWVERTRVDRLGVATRYEQVFIPATGTHALFPNGAQSARGNFAGRRFVMPPQATRRVVTMTIDEGFATQEDVLNNHVTTAPGLEPINVVPKKIAERHMRLKGEIYAGMSGRERWLDPETKLRKPIPGFLHGYVPPTRSGLFLYDRLDLHDPDRLPDKRSPTTAFIGHTRLGMPAYMMQLDVEIRGTRPARAVSFYVHGYLVTSEQKALSAITNAIVGAKAARDKVLLRTALHRPPASQDGYTTASGLRSDSIVFAL